MRKFAHLAQVISDAARSRDRIGGLHALASAGPSIPRKRPVQPQDANTVSPRSLARLCAIWNAAWCMPQCLAQNCGGRITSPMAAEYQMTAATGIAFSDAARATPCIAAAPRMATGCRSPGAALSATNAGNRGRNERHDERPHEAHEIDNPRGQRQRR